MIYRNKRPRITIFSKNKQKLNSKSENLFISKQMRTFWLNIVFSLILFVIVLKDISKVRRIFITKSLY